jgi:hypothetical protein
MGCSNSKWFHQTPNRVNRLAKQMPSDRMGGRMRLVENWRRAHRFISVQLMALTAALQGVWPSIPQDLKDALPHGLVNWVSIVLLGAAVLGRLLDQGSVTEPKQ